MAEKILYDEEISLLELKLNNLLYLGLFDEKAWKGITTNDLKLLHELISFGIVATTK